MTGHGPSLIFEDRSRTVHTTRNTETIEVMYRTAFGNCAHSKSSYASCARSARRRMPLWTAASCKASMWPPASLTSPACVATCAARIDLPAAGYAIRLRRACAPARSLPESRHPTGRDSIRHRAPVLARVSFMRRAATTPDSSVSPATSHTAAASPNRSAVNPASSAPTA
jgi:hypothetical protein